MKRWKKYWGKNTKYVYALNDKKIKKKLNYVVKWVWHRRVKLEQDEIQLLNEVQMKVELNCLGFKWEIHFNFSII